MGQTEEIDMSQQPRFPLLREFLRRFAPLAPVGIVAGGYVVLTSSESEALLFGSSAMEGILFGLGILIFYLVYRARGSDQL